MISRRIIGHALKAALGAGILWFLIRSGTLEPGRIGRAFGNHPWLCAAGFAAYLLLVVVPTWLRWLLLTRLAGISMGSWRAWKLHMVGLLFNSIVPGGAGGDLVKGYYLFQEEGRGRALALTSLAMDRFAGLYGLLCMGMIMTLLNTDLWEPSPALRLNSLFYASVFLVFTAGIAFCLSPLSRIFLKHPSLHRLPGGRFLKSFSDSLLVYLGRPWGLLASVLLSLVVHGGFILVYFAFSKSLDMTLSLRTHGFAVPVLTLINGIPISPAGMGVGEVAGEALYRTLGGGEGGSEVLALFHLCVIVTSLAGLPFYLLYRANRTDARASAP